MCLFQHFAVFNFDDAVGGFVGKGQAGVAQVVGDGVLVAPYRAAVAAARADTRWRGRLAPAGFRYSLSR